MTQWFTDFASDTVGAAPGGWTERWVTTGGQVEVLDTGLPAGALGSRAVRMTLSGNNRYAVSWDVPGTPTGDVEIVMHAYFSGITGGTRRRLILHGSGAAGAEQGYFIEEIANTRTDLAKYVAGTGPTVIAPAVNSAPMGWRWMRLQRSGTTIRYRTWGDSDLEPETWDGSVIDTSLGLGWLGFGSFASTSVLSRSIWVDAFGVGTGADGAPTASLDESAPSILPPDQIPESVLTGHRQERWWVERLNVGGGSEGKLDGVREASVENNVNAQISGSGRLLVDRVAGVTINWLADRVRTWWQVGAYAWPLGTYIPSVPTAGYRQVQDALGTRSMEPVWSVELLDTLTVMAEDAITDAYSLPAGSIVTDAVIQVITDAGETAAVTPSDETLLVEQTWPAGTSRLRIANDLLQTINYFSLRADGWGRLAAQPYRSPASRPVARAFVPGETSIHLPEITREEDLWKVPNVVILRTQGTEDSEGLTSVLFNDDPDDPLSTVGRGRVIAHVEENVEASSQQVLDEIAERTLRDLAAPIAKLELSHAIVPLSINDVIEIEDEAHRRGVVQTTSTTLAVGALTRTTILEVKS